MNRLKLHLVFISFLLISLTVASISFAASTKNGEVVVYNSGQALVGEIRTVTLPRGPANVVIKDVPATLDASSVRATAKGMTVQGVQYRFEPATERNLLKHYVGKELTVLTPSTEGEGYTKRQGTLLSNQAKPVFLFGKEIYTGAYAGLLFPELPDDVQEAPVLVLDTHNASPGKRDIRLNYLMSGLSWKANYALSIDKSGNKADLVGMATIGNKANHSFTSTALTLVAGDVQRARPMYAKAASRNMAMDAELAMAPAPMSEGTVSQYYTYELDSRVDIPGGTTRQIRLFGVDGVGVDQQLISRYHAENNIRGSKVKQTVESRLVIANTKKNGMGRALPAGLVRVYMPSSSGQQLLVGEPSINHVGNGAALELRLGNSFDVQVTRSMTSYKKLGKRSFEISWNISVINGKSKAQSLKLMDGFSGEWKVSKANQKYTKPDGNTLQFDLTVPPSKDGKPTVVTYTAQVSY